MIQTKTSIEQRVIKMTDIKQRIIRATSKEKKKRE